MSSSNFVRTRENSVQGYIDVSVQPHVDNTYGTPFPFYLEGLIRVLFETPVTELSRERNENKVIIIGYFRPLNKVYGGRRGGLLLQQQCRLFIKTILEPHY